MFKLKTRMQKKNFKTHDFGQYIMLTRAFIVRLQVCIQKHYLSRENILFLKKKIFIVKVRLFILMFQMFLYLGRFNISYRYLVYLYSVYKGKKYLHSLQS